MLVPGSLRTAKRVREGRAALISKIAGLKAAWNTETETKTANLRIKLWTCCLVHNWLEMNAEQSRTLARWCNLLCFLHLFPYAQFWLIAVATMFLKLKSLTKKKKELTNTYYYPTLLATHALNEIFALVYKGTCVMEDCAVKGSTAQIRGAVLKWSFFLSSANCSWTQNICETPVLNALGQACKETEKLDL